MNLLRIYITFLIIKPLWSIMNNQFDKNISNVAVEIINGLNPKELAILAVPLANNIADPVEIIKSDTEADSDNLNTHIDDFIYQIHKLNFKSVIFYDEELFFQFIESNLQGSIESVSLIFNKPHKLSLRIHDRKLSHRLSLFIFYWGAKHAPPAREAYFKEPIRAVVITRPRRKAIYYNQAVPNGKSNLKLVNWYDGDNLGLQKVPLLPSAASVYSNFNERVFRVPVFNSPPWFWVSYENESIEMTNIEEYLTILDSFDSDVYYDIKEVNVTGGRDHRLLELLAKHMNFQFVYIEAPGRTQGVLRSENDANESFTGGLGLLQNGLADLLLGDVSLSWERRKAVEFSFFTLVDSGAFATHAPRRLNEALAIIRPFKLDVWPYLIVTVLLSGPIFYAIIIIPYKWHKKSNEKNSCQNVEHKFHMVYIKEITINSEAARKLLRQQKLDLIQRGIIDDDEPDIPRSLFDRCIWFTVQLFLKQSCKEPYHGYRAKFLMIVYWIAATYVLSSQYSAQLTSQFARPAHEQPINTLQRLETVMIREGYQLFVEKESSSLEMLENGTEIFRRLFALMKQQTKGDAEDFLIDSVESGLKLIADGFENKAVLGGRETLYFNIQQFGSKNFQLSQKLYTRYSAVAVQIGCPFLDSLNDVLIHLFEGGILDKMTTEEYEAQSRMISKEINTLQNNPGSDGATESILTNEDHNNANTVNGKGVENAQEQQQSQDALVIQPLNLRMLQGAFIVLFVGHSAAACILLLELFCYRMNFKLHDAYTKHMRPRFHWNYHKFRKMARLSLVRILR